MVVKRFSLYLFILLFIILNKNLHAQDNLENNSWTSARPDGHAPAGVMGDHFHSIGEIMFSYRYMNMFMKGNLSGSDDISDERIFNDYMTSPQKMAMGMHMIGAMYAVSDYLTLMIMANYVVNNMDLQTKTGANFSTSSSGFGDLPVSGLFKVFNMNHQSLHAILGLSIPLGNIDQRDDTPMMDNINLAYPMQLGSGTWDPFLGATYLIQTGIISGGLQTKYKFRIWENKEDYTLGDKYVVTGWGAVKASRYFSFSLRLAYENITKITGADPDMNAMMMPLLNTENSGRSLLAFGLGSNFYVPEGKYKNVRIGVEIMMPVYQDVRGIQMKNKLNGVMALQYSFGGHH